MRSEHAANLALAAALQRPTWALQRPIPPRYRQRTAKRRGGVLLGLLVASLLVSACTLL